MKIKIAYILIGLLTTLSLTTSCLKNDNEYYYSGETSITSFSLGTLKVWKMGTDKYGRDSIYYDTIPMAKYPFTIDQLNRRIVNRDSLPVGTDISKVIVHIEADSEYILYGKISKEGEEATDTTWTNKDSLNFEIAPDHSLKFKVLSYSGIMGEPYTVKVNVHQQEPDSLQWAEDETALRHEFQSGSLSKQKAICIQNTIYIFGVQENGNSIIESISVNENGVPEKAWSQIAIPQHTNTYSATLWNDNIYFLADNQLYELNEEDAYNVSQYNPSDFTLAQILGAVTTSSTSKLYGYTTDNEFVECVVDENGSRWIKTNEQAISLPNVQQRFSSVNIPLSYNLNISRTVIMGYNSSAIDGTGVVAYKLTNDQTWTAYNYANSDSLTAPNIEDGTLIYYDKKLYTFGGKNTSKDYQTYESPFSAIYCSTDNGLTWNRTIRYFKFPKGDNSFTSKYEEGTEGEGCYSCTIDKNNFIWLIWHNGYMSRGRVNRLGFLPKWP